MTVKKPGAKFALWLAVGVAVGVALNQLALWIAVGMVVGAAEATLARRRSSQDGGMADGMAKRN
jgi:hypothetical protein